MNAKVIYATAALVSGTKTTNANRCSALSQWELCLTYY